MLNHLQNNKVSSIFYKSKNTAFVVLWTNYVESSKYPYERIVNFVMNNDALWQNALLTSHSVMSRVIITKNTGT
jgi:hypothetical protein